MALTKHDYVLLAQEINKGVVRSKHGTYTLTDLALDLAWRFQQADPFFDKNEFLQRAVGFIPSEG